MQTAFQFISALIIHALLAGFGMDDLFTSFAFYTLVNIQSSNVVLSTVFGGDTGDGMDFAFSNRLYVPVKSVASKLPVCFLKIILDL